MTSLDRLTAASPRPRQSRCTSGRSSEVPVLETVELCESVAGFRSTLFLRTQGIPDGIYRYHQIAY